MLGSRDSETAAVVRDTDMIWSTMDGEPYLVGRFAHTLRIRLMREHLGLDVDEVMEEERRVELDREESEFEAKMNGIYDETEDTEDQAKPSAQSHTLAPEQAICLSDQERLRSFNHDVDWEEEGNPNLQAEAYKFVTTDKRVMGNHAHAAEVDGEGPDRMKEAEKAGLTRGRDSVIVDGGKEVLVSNIDANGKGTLDHPIKPHLHRASRASKDSEDSGGPSNNSLPPMPELPRRTTEQLGLTQLSQLPALPHMDDTDIGGPPLMTDTAGNAILKPFNPLTADIQRAPIDKDCMRDPLNDSFYDAIWMRIADNNTKIFRRVFRCNPDNEVQNWHDYTDYIAYAERFAQAQAGTKSNEREEQEAPGKSGPPGAVVTGLGAVPSGLANLSEKVTTGHSQGSHPLGTVAEWAEDASQQNRSRVDTASTREGDLKGQLDGIDEKAAMKKEASNEASSPVQPAGDETFPSLETTFLSNPSTSVDPEKAGASQPAPRKTTFSADPSATRAGTNTINSVGSKKRRRGTSKGSRKGFSGSDDLLASADVEELLSMVQGHLVMFPYDWLIKEELNSNWLYQVDQVAPLQI